MKKLKSNKGAITIIVLVSILFFVSFLISSYVIVANKVQNQKEIIEETKRTYESSKTMDEIYNSYFANGEIIPIFNEEQLLKIGTEEDININGKIYKFSNNATYVLMENIEFNAYNFDTVEEEFYWQPMGDIESKTYNFDGNGKTITVNYIDQQNDEYSITYSEKNNYSEPEYEFKVTPKLNNEVIAENANVLVNDESTEVIGEQIIKIKRKQVYNVKIVTGIGYEEVSKEILIINPNKIQEEYNSEEDCYNLEFNISLINAKADGLKIFV